MKAILTIVLITIYSAAWSQPAGIVARHGGKLIYPQHDGKIIAAKSSQQTSSAYYDSLRVITNRYKNELLEFYRGNRWWRSCIFL